MDWQHNLFIPLSIMRNDEQVNRADYTTKRKCTRERWLQLSQLFVRHNYFRRLAQVARRRNLSKPEKNIECICKLSIQQL